MRRAKSTRFLLSGLFSALGILALGGVQANPFPPNWQGGAGPAVHFPPVAWPNEPANAADCGNDCGDWVPYSRFQSGVADPRVQDPSNGGTAPQNYVNVASSCVDKNLPSIYYALRRGATPANDVLMFRWRVEQIANTYATGPSAGSFSSSDPWNSALWTVLFDIDGSGYRTLAAHLNGSSGSPSTAIDMVAGIWGSIPTQSIDYLTDPNIRLIAHNPTAFVDGPLDGNSGRLLNFRNSLSPSNSWPNGSAETVWDYGTTRARLVSKNSCTEYFIDYQIPIAMLDASGLTDSNGKPGPKIDRNTPISMLFCTANSLNNPFQKDCALNRGWVADPTKPGPFGDYISFNRDEAYRQPIVSSVSATGPASCSGGSTQLQAKVQDTLWVDAAGVVKPSVKSVRFVYWRDVNDNGEADAGDVGSAWTLAANGVLATGTLNTWGAAWNTSGLLKGRYLIGVQAVDDRTLVDNGVPAAPVDNRTYSYLVGDNSGALPTAKIYSNDWSWDGASKTWVQGSAIGWLPGQEAAFAAQPHAVPMLAGSGEDWFGNPDATGVRIATAGVELALNTCGLAPTLGKTASPSAVAVGEPVTFTLSLANTTPGPLAVSQVQDFLPTGFTYQSTVRIENDAASVTPATGPTLGDGGTLSWSFTGLQVAAGRTLVLEFIANAGDDAGTYNNSARAETDFGDVDSPVATVAVDSARISLSKTPSVYSINPDGSTQLTYTLRYANDASVPLTAASISDPLPAGTTYVSCSGGSACGLTAGTVNWTIGSLAPGASGSVTLTLTVNTSYASTTLVNTATLQATPPSGPPVTKPATSTIAVNVPTPAFTLSKSSAVAQIAPAGSVTWTLSYRNFGNATAAGSLLVDTLPAGFTFSSCSVAGNPHFTGCTHSNGVVTFHEKASGSASPYTGVSIAAAATGSVTLTATAAASPFTFPNPATNLARLTWTGNPTGVSAEAQLGVTGDFCSAVYYFRAGNLASSTAPTSTTETFSQFSIANGSPASITFTSPASTFATDISGKTFTVNFFLSAAQGNNDFQVTLRNVTKNETIAISTLATIGNTGITTPNAFTFTGTVGAGRSIALGDVLEWNFVFSTGSGAARNVRFYYDSTQHASRSSFCTASAPASLSIDKTVDKPQLASVPQALAYTIKVANTGGTAAAATQVVDTLPTGVSYFPGGTATFNGSPISPAESSGQTLTFSLGSLAAGGSGTLVINAQALASASGTLTNTAVASATGVSAVQDTADTLVGALGSGAPAQLVMAKSVNTSLIGAGETVTYALNVVNVGGTAATGVTVTDDFPNPAWFSYVANSCESLTGSCSVNAGVLTWTLGNLAPGQSATLRFQMRSAATGIPAGVTQLDNAAVASDAAYCTGGSPPASCTSEVVPVIVSGAPRLDLQKAVAPTGTRAAGDTLTYTLTLANLGSATATDVLLLDPLPAYAGFIEIIDARVDGVDSLSLARFDAVNNRVRFAVGDLPAGTIATLSFTARIAATLPSGSTTLSNVASASAGNAPAVTASVDSTASAAPQLDVVKSGPAAAASPAAVLSSAASATRTVFVDDTSRLVLGQTVRIGGTLAVVESLSARSIGVSVPVTAASGSSVDAAIRYALTYRNSGTAVASSATVTDTLPAGLQFVSASPAPASSPTVGSSGSVVWNLGDLAVGASGTLQLIALPAQSGDLTNTARIAASNDCSGGSPPARCIDSVVTAVGGLRVSKSTSTPVVQAGTSATYLVEVRNTKSSAASGVRLADPLTAGFTYASTIALTINGSPASGGLSPSVGDQQPTWGDFTIPAGGVLRLEFIANVAASVGTATYDNSFTVTSTDTGVEPFDPLATTAEDVTVLGLDSGLLNGIVYRDLNANGSFDPTIDTPLPGVTVNLTDGNGVLFTTISDASGFFQRIVPPGAVTVAVASADLPAGVQPTVGSDGVIPATVTVPSGGSASKNAGYVAAGAVTPIVATNDSYGPVNGGSGAANLGSVFVNDTLNGSPFAASAVTASVVGSLPAGVSFTAATGVVGVLPGTAPGTLSFDYRLCEAASPLNCATATVTITVVAAPPLPQAVDDSDSTAVNTPVTTAVLTNDSLGVAPTTITASTQGSNGTVSCTTTQCTYTPANGFSGVDTYTYTITDSNGATSTATVTVTIAAPTDADLAIAKSVSNAAPTVGTQIVFTLVATNLGPANATGVQVSDVLPSGYVHVSDSGAGAYVPGTGVWTIGNLATGASASLAITVTVQPSGNYANTAIITGTQTDPNPTNNTATANPVPVGVPQWTLDKRIVFGAPFAFPGDLIDYAFDLHNTGAIAISGISLVDDKIGAVTCPQTSLAGGASMTCTARYAVTDADVSLGSVTNIATATGTPASGTLAPATDTATATRDPSCGGNGLVSGRVWADANRNSVIDAGEGGLTTLVSLAPAAATPATTRLSASDANGAYRFQAVAPGTYTVRMVDAFLDNVLGLVPVNANQTTVAVAACGIVSFDAGYAAPQQGRVGDFVWYDQDLSGNVNEYFDTDGNNQLTLNALSGDLTLADFEWIDLNGNSVADAGEFNRCGLAGVPVELLDESGTVLDQVLTDARGSYTFRGLAFGARYATRVNPDEPRTFTQAQGMAQSGLCKPFPPVTKAVMGVPAAKAVPPGCGFSRQSRQLGILLTAGTPQDLNLDFGVLCGSASSTLAVDKTLLGSDDLDSSGGLSAGDVLRYRIVATNTGNVVLSGVVVRDPLLTPNRRDCAFVPAAGTCVLEGTYTLQAADVSAGRFRNTAFASANEAPEVSDAVEVPIAPAPVPMIGVAKRLVSLTGTGPFDLEFQFVLRNYGTVALSAVQLVDDLRRTFPLPASVQVLGVTTTGSIAGNPAYDGLGDTRLLLPASSTLAVGAQGEVRLRLRLAPGGGSGPYRNTAVVSGQSPTGVTVEDDSQDGANADPDNNGLPVESTPTLIALPAAAPLTIPADAPWALLLLALTLGLAGAFRGRQGPSRH